MFCVNVLPHVLCLQECVCCLFFGVHVFRFVGQVSLSILKQFCFWRVQFMNGSTIAENIREMFKQHFIGRGFFFRNGFCQVLLVVFVRNDRL